MSTTKNNINEEILEFIKLGVKKLELNSIDYYTIIDLTEYCSAVGSSAINSFISILFALFLSLNKKSVCMKLEKNELIEDLKPLNISDKILAEQIEYFVKNISDFKSVIGFDENDYKPLIIKEYDKEMFLYSQKNFINERKLKILLEKFLNSETTQKPTDDLLEKIHDLNLNGLQKNALILSIQNNLTIISGGPGTGKTYTIFWIIKLLIDAGYKADRIKLAAPTGRAAENLNFSLGNNAANEKIISENIKAETIHRLLNYHYQKGSFLYNDENKIPLDVLIVDEVSMLDIDIAVKLFSALPENSKIILIGDKNQLPSVDTGSILQELIPDNPLNNIPVDTDNLSGVKSAGSLSNNISDRTVILEESYRTRGLADIIAAKINKSDQTFFDDIIKTNLKIFENENLNPSENCFFIPENGSKNSIDNLIAGWINKFFLKTDYNKVLSELLKLNIAENNISEIKNELSYLFSILNNSKILTIIKESKYGLNYINDAAKDLYKKNYNLEGNKFYTGLPVIVTENNYRLSLFNGETGMVIKDKHNFFKVIFKKGEDYILHGMDFLHSLETSYAVTVHKSQGSEFNNILLVLPKQESPILTKEIIYTGITRAKENVFIFSDEDILKKASAKKIKRTSTLNKIL